MTTLYDHGSHCFPAVKYMYMLTTGMLQFNRIKIGEVQ